MNSSKTHYLVDETIDLINNRSVKVQLTFISKDTGIPVAWISLFAKRGIKDPSANRVLKLYEYMTGNKVKEIIASKN